MMPQSSQNLYFHLGMNADDDGFCEHFTLMRMTDSKPDDLKILQAKGFVRVFDDRVLVINDWKENNYLRSDRYTPSKYLDVYKEELKLLTASNMDSGIPDGNQMATQVRLGKVRLGKDTNTAPDGASGGEPSDNKQISELIDLFKEVNPSYRTLFARKPQRSAAERLIKEHGFDRVASMIAFLPRSNAARYAPTITTPYELESNLGRLKAWADKQKDTSADARGNNFIL